MKEQISDCYKKKKKKEENGSTNMKKLTGQQMWK